MATNVYECMFILDSNRYARNPAGVAGQIPQLVEDCGGEVLASRLWNEQRLAYVIGGHRKGAYWLAYFRMDSNDVVKFNRACRLNENILRNLTLRVEPRLVDTLVAHARGEAPPTPEETPDAPATGKTAVAPTGEGSTEPSTGDVGEPAATPESATREGE